MNNESHDNPTIDLGDVVICKQGDTQAMCVNRYLGNDTFECVWRIGGTPYKKAFKSDELVKVDIV